MRCAAITYNRLLAAGNNADSAGPQGTDLPSERHSPAAVGVPAVAVLAAY